MENGLILLNEFDASMKWMNSQLIAQKWGVSNDLMELQWIFIGIIAVLKKRRAALIGIRKFAPSKTPKIVYT